MSPQPCGCRGRLPFEKGKGGIFVSIEDYEIIYCPLHGAAAALRDALLAAMKWQLKDGGLAEITGYPDWFELAKTALAQTHAPEGG